MIGIEKLNSTGTLTKVTLKDCIVFYSYSTPVAIKCKEFLGRTDKKYSVTTSQHLNQTGLDKKMPHDDFVKLLQQYNIV